MFFSKIEDVFLDRVLCKKHHWPKSWFERKIGKISHS